MFEDHKKRAVRKDASFFMKELWHHRVMNLFMYNWMVLKKSMITEKIAATYLRRDSFSKVSKLFVRHLFENQTILNFLIS
jgi:hypothetical protein